MLRSIVLASSLALLATSITTGTARAQAPLAEDVASPEAIVAAVYDVLARAPGEPFQWDRFRSLYLPQAQLVPATEQTGGQFRLLTPDEFITWVDEHTTIGGEHDRGFSEEGLHHESHRYGDVAQVFSTYQKRYWDDDRILGRGINAFQLVRHDGRWWIASVVWDEETGAGSIPDEYMP